MLSIKKHWKKEYLLIIAAVLLTLSKDKEFFYIVLNVIHIVLFYDYTVH